MIIKTDYYIHNKPDAPEHLLLSNTNWWDEAIATFKENSTGKGCQGIKEKIKGKEGRVIFIMYKYYMVKTFTCHKVFNSFLVS